MNDEMEQLLCAQPLRRPTASLDGRVSRLLSATNPRWRAMVIGFVPTALAASVALAVWIQPEMGDTPRNDSVTVAPSEKLVRVEQVVSHVTPGKLMVTPDNEPVRPVRVQNLYQTRWFDEKSNMYIEETVPEDQVVFVSAPVY